MLISLLLLHNVGYTVYNMLLKEKRFHEKKSEFSGICVVTTCSTSILLSPLVHGMDLTVNVILIDFSWHQNPEPNQIPQTLARILIETDTVIRL